MPSIFDGIFFGTKTKSASKNKIAKVSLKPKRKVVKKDKKLTNDELSL